MFKKILVFAVSVITVSSSDHHYTQHVEQHEPPKEYRYPYEHQIRVQEPTSEEYKPDHHGHAYSSQSVLHQGQTAAFEESHQTNSDHEAPTYQYHVNENAEEHTPVHKYHPVHYPSHQVHAIRVPVHHKTPAYYQSHVVSHKPTYYQADSHEVQHQTGHHFQPESHEVPPYQAVNEHQAAPEHYAIPAHASAHHGVPEHQNIAHNAVPEHHAIEHNTVPEHHAIPVHHVADSHDLHDEPIDYYAYPKYQYEYKVEDPHTGDNKFQHEFRDGDVVKGIYGLHEPDGSIRTVEYSSDKHHGFSAIVKHSAPGQHVHIESHHPSHE